MNLLKMKIELKMFTVISKKKLNDKLFMSQRIKKASISMASARL